MKTDREARLSARLACTGAPPLIGSQQQLPSSASSAARKCTSPELTSVLQATSS